MKKIYLLISLFLMILFCSVKRELTIPVLLEYELYYPDEAKRQSLEGSVLVTTHVNENGRPEKTRIYKSSGIALLDSAALQTASTFIFSPAIVDGKPQRIWVNIPVEFKLESKGIDAEAWLIEVNVLQRTINKDYQEEKVSELYSLYKRLIYSPVSSRHLKINNYIKQAVLDQTAKIWDGYWSVYPAPIILFVDIINRYPTSPVSTEASEDFHKFFESEAIQIRNTLSTAKADTVINRLNEIIKK